MTSPAFLTFWGKARPVPSAPAAWHPAAWHCLDVAAVAQALLEVDPARAEAPARACGWEPHLWARAAVFLVALHDLGKFSLAFQAKAEACWPVAALGPYKAAPGVPHDEAGLALLEEGGGPLALERVLAGWGPTTRRVLLRAIAGHHGRPAREREDGLPPDVVCRACRDAAYAFAETVAALLDPPALARPRERDAALAGWWLAGLTVLADWAGSAQPWFPYAGKDDPPTPDAYWHDVALPNARRAVAASGLLPAAPSKALGLRALAPEIAEPAPVQRLAETLALPDGPACFLVEDVTGGGKTEAALVLAHRLIAAGRADGAFVALPTMATADAMFERVASSYRRLFDPAASPSLALAHGRAKLNDLFTGSVLRDFGADEAAGKDAAEEGASAQCAAWLADDRRLAFLAQVGVGTVDQALLAVLPARHAALRLHGLARKVLIVDEAHAYDAYMGEELQRLLTFQAALGGNAVVLSATLPRITRTKLLAAFRAGLRAPAPAPTSAHYPLVTVVGRDRFEERPADVRPGLERCVPVRRLIGPEEAVAELVEAVRKGACAVWVRNTVADALAGAEALRAAGIEPLLFHARYAMGDRLDIQDEVLRAFGKKSGPGERAPGGVGRVLVATQVVEQSLDLDFDVLVSDLAPVDLLVQRAGRLWRHERGARKLDGPELLVVSPEPLDAPGGDWAAGPLGGTRFVYRPDVLWRSARALFAVRRIVSPGGVRALVEAVYGEGVEPVPDALAAAQRRGEGEDAAARGHARSLLLDPWKGYRADRSVWDPDTLVSTRLGEQRTVLRLAREEAGRLVPWCDDADPRRAWALSEVEVRRALATGAVVPAGLKGAVDRLRAGWKVWEREIPVLVLEPVAGGWRGRAARGDEARDVLYDRVLGFHPV